MSDENSIFQQFKSIFLDFGRQAGEMAVAHFKRGMSNVLKSEIKLVYTKDEAAKFLGYKSASSIEKLIQSGALGSFKFTVGDSGAVRVGLIDLICFLDRHHLPTTAHNRIKFDDFHKYPSDGFEVTEKGFQLLGDTDTKQKKGAA
ncbi:MAG TPA: hypothetical protein VF644_10415 [Pyrinomonadaceae bacterium]